MNITYNKNGFRVVEIYKPVEPIVNYQYLIKDLSIECNKKLKIKKVTVEYEIAN